MPSFTCKRGDDGRPLGRCNVAGCSARARMKCSFERVAGGACDRTLCDEHAVQSPAMKDKFLCPYHAQLTKTKP